MENKKIPCSIENSPAPIRSEGTSKALKDFSDGNPRKHMIVMISSIVGGLLLWFILSMLFPRVEAILSTPTAVVNAFVSRIQKGWYFSDVWASLSRVLVGYSLAAVCSIPVAFLMAWYKPIRGVCDPWIQFLRTIPPIAIIPIMVAAFGTGEQPKWAIIFIAVFLTMTVTIYQGIRNVDLTLIKASYTFGAKDMNIFFDVMIPAAFPFILVAMRLGIGAALTTLIAAEMTGASDGLGSMIQLASGVNRIDIVMMGIVSIGILGFALDRLLLYIERKLTQWK